MYCSSEHAFVVQFDPTLSWKTSWNERKTALSVTPFHILRPMQHYKRVQNMRTIHATSQTELYVLLKNGKSENDKLISRMEDIKIIDFVDLLCFNSLSLEFKLSRIYHKYVYQYWKWSKSYVNYSLMVM